MAPGARSKFGPPCSQLRSFGSKCTVFNKIIVTVLGLFGAPAVAWCLHGDSAPGQLYPLAPPSFRLCVWVCLCLFMYSFFSFSRVSPLFDQRRSCFSRSNRSNKSTAFNFSRFYCYATVCFGAPVCCLICVTLSEVCSQLPGMP